MIEIACWVCSKVFLVYPSAIGRKKYCSKNCQDIAYSCPVDCLCSKHATKVTLTCQTCGKTFRVSPSVSHRKYCSQKCYPRPGSHYDRTGYKNPNWRGGQIVEETGRVLVYAPDHPNANGCYVYRYRIVAAEKLGRPLSDDEIVHHIDGNVSNDVPENLEVMTQSEHFSTHLTELHAKGLIPTYNGIRAANGQFLPADKRGEK